MNNRNLILIVPEAGLLRLGFRHGWVLARALLHVEDCGKRMEEAKSVVTLIRALTPLLRVLPHNVM